jgi:hypothetical protein
VGRSTISPSVHPRRRTEHLTLAGVGEVMGEIVGASLYAKVSKPDELMGHFNAHQQGRLLVQVEEGFWAGD